MSDALRPSLGRAAVSARAGDGLGPPARSAALRAFECLLVTSLSRLSVALQRSRVARGDLLAGDECRQCRSEALDGDEPAVAARIPSDSTSPAEVGRGRDAPPSRSGTPGRFRDLIPLDRLSVSHGDPLITCALPKCHGTEWH